ncbi:LOW QUALITY PROTEIN: uncharacterized protein WCC33_003912 [Rhinophrynus dorsalis]
MANRQRLSKEESHPQNLKVHHPSPHALPQIPVAAVGDPFSAAEVLQPGVVFQVEMGFCLARQPEHQLLEQATDVRVWKKMSDGLALEASILRWKDFSDSVIATLLKAHKPISCKVYHRGFTPASSLPLEDSPSELLNSEEFHTLLNTAMSRSVNLAIQSAMGLMSSNTAASISSALRAAHVPSIQDHGHTTLNVAPTGAPSKKATSKSKHADTPASINVQSDSGCAVTDGMIPPLKRAQYWEKTVHKWKKARALGDLSDSDSDSEEASEGSEDVILCSESEDDDTSVLSAPPQEGVTPKIDNDHTLLHPQGEPLFDPDNLLHPRTADWFPVHFHVAKYLASRVRKPLNKATRNKLRAECPIPIVPDMVCNTPVVDPKISQFLGKTGWKAKKGLDYCLRNCKDKVLDVLGPCTKIFEMVEEAISGNEQMDLLSVRGWIQRVIYLTGNANTALATEWRKAILLKIEPKLINMATSGPGPQVKGFLYRDNFVMEFVSFVQTFTALDKAQSSMKWVFGPKVFHGAGRGRGLLSGHFTRGPSMVLENHCSGGKTTGQ